MFYLEKQFADEIIAHALEDAPNECCGIVAGVNGEVKKLYRTTNTEHSPVKYNIDPQELFQAYKETEEKGWEFLAFYHSHTASEAYPSPTDVHLAAWPDCIYIIVSLMNRDTTVIRAFKIVDGQIQEEELQII